MTMKLIGLIVIAFGACACITDGQMRQPSADQLSLWKESQRCTGSFQSETLRCEAVLPDGLNAKKNKAGDHVLIRIAAVIDPAKLPITAVDATIIEVQPEVNGRSVLRIRIDKGIQADGRELPLEARILAVAAPSNIAEGWRFPMIIVDRFPRIPEDDERLPGERKLSKDVQQASPLDSLPETPVYYKAICSKPEKSALAGNCTNLLDAKGVYGRKGMLIEPTDPLTPADSFLTSKKSIRLDAGTVLVLEITFNRGLAPNARNQEPE
jgi:hypothetical protein